MYERLAEAVLKSGQRMELGVITAPDAERPGRGEMRWTAGEDAEAELFRPGRVVARDARWDDWGFVAWLGLLPVAADEELPRSRVMRLKSRGMMEGAYVRLLLTREQEPGMA